MAATRNEWWLILDDHLMRVAAKFTDARKTLALDAEHHIYPLRAIGSVELKTKYESDGAGRPLYLRSAHLTFAVSPDHNLSVGAQHPQDGTLVPEAIILFAQQLMTRTSGTTIQAVREAS